MCVSKSLLLQEQQVYGAKVHQGLPFNLILSMPHLQMTTSSEILGGVGEALSIQHRNLAEAAYPAPGVLPYIHTGMQ